jgi:hypothetical protein
MVIHVDFVKVGGDQAPDNANSSVEVYSLKSRKWRTTNPTLNKRDSCRLAVLGGNQTLVL